MPTLDFPTSIRPARVRWKLLSNTQVHESPLSGVPTSYELPGARWEAVLEFRDWRRAELAVLEVLIARLRGRAGRFRLWHHAREIPRGVATGAPVVCGNQNMLTWSEQFDNAAWTFTNSPTITPDAAVSPAGTTTGDLIVPADGLDTACSRVLTIAEGDVYAPSLYAKTAGMDTITFSAAASVFGAEQTVVFDLATGEPTTTAGTATGHIDPDIGGWFRLSLTGLPSVVSSGDHECYRWTLPVGDGVAGMYFFGGQLQPYGRGDYIETEDAPALPEAQTGTALRTSGWTPNTLGVLMAGDLLEVNGELKMLVQDADSDTFGNATLVFEPPLRSAPPDMTPIITTRPCATFMLAADDIDIEHARSLGSLTLSCMEAIE